MTTYITTTHIEHYGPQVVDNLNLGFSQIGWQYSSNNPDFHFFVGNGGNLPDPSNIQCGKKVLILTENIPVDINTPNNRFKAFLLDRYIHVWDYVIHIDVGIEEYVRNTSQKQIKAKFVNMNYLSIKSHLITNNVNGNKDNKCVFTGQPDGRRLRLINVLKDKGVNVDIINSIGLEEWTNKLSAYPFILNIHYDDSVHNELLRIMYGMATGSLVISEKLMKPELFYLKHDFNIVIVDTIDYLRPDFLASINKEILIKNAHATLHEHYLPNKIAGQLAQVLQ